MKMTYLKDQEEHKVHVDINEWQCGYCKKSFRAEKFLDQHFDNRHYNLLNVVCALYFPSQMQPLYLWLSCKYKILFYFCTNDSLYQVFCIIVNHIFMYLISSLSYIILRFWFSIGSDDFGCCLWGLWTMRYLWWLGFVVLVAEWVAKEG